MTKQVQRRRGSSSEHTSFTGAAGEISVNTTNNTMHVHDGSTAGGFESARSDLDNVSTSDITSGISGGTVATLTITSADINGGTLDNVTIGGSTAAAGTFTNITASGTINLNGSTVSDGGTVTTVDIDGGSIDGATIGANSAAAGTFTTLTSTGDAVIGGDLTVNGTTTTINSTTVTVDDLNMVLASGAASAAAANGAGLTIDGASATFTYASTGDKWTMNKDLDVTGEVEADSLTVTGDLTVDTNTLFVDSTNNLVGIGTSDPSSNTSTFYDDLVIKNDTSGTGAGITIQSNSTNGFGAVEFRKADGTEVGKVYASSAGGQLAFETGGTERMRIDSSGNVGINVDSPNGALHIKDQTDIAMSNDADGQLIIEGNGYSGAIALNATGMQIYQNSSARSIIFGTDETQRMLIDGTGNVGINTSSPTSYGNSQTALVIEDSGSPAIVLSDTGQTRDWFMVAQGSGLYFNYADGGGSSSASNVTQALYLDSLGKVYIQTTSDTNYAQTSGDSSWMYRSTNGAVIQAQDADDAFSMMYMNKFNWNNTKDSRYIDWTKNGSSVGSISLTSGGLISYGGTSDYRLKENVVDMTGAIDRIKQAQPKQFNMIDDPNDTTQDGFLAHELATVVPQAVTGTHNQVKTRTNVIRSIDGNYIEEGITEDEWTAGKTDGVYPTDSTWSASWDEPIYQMADYAKLTPLLTAALQEAIAKIETLETQNASLEARIEALENA